VCFNVGLLGYYKYAGFVVDNLLLCGWASQTLEVVLPIGISFFTFTQIAYIIDCHAGEVREYSARNYLLFVTYFPHLIAGPILHHKEMMPQFARADACRLDPRNLAVGASIFVFGLFKKVGIADHMATYATPVFDFAHETGAVGTIDAWFGALAYTLQLYFDFSGYSDMAIGLSLLFNVRLPLNFNSPYKAVSIIDFWKRWHMTLSRFLRDYVYIPMGGSRCSATRRYANLLLTMLIGGIWHGAGWTFICWGALHGLYLVINHAWRGMLNRCGINDSGMAIEWAYSILTFLCVVVGWVVFRATTLSSAETILWAMIGGGTTTGGQVIVGSPMHAALTIIIGLTIVRFFPNVIDLFTAQNPTCHPAHLCDVQSAWARRFAWKPTWKYAACCGLLLYWCIFMIGARGHSEFLYFQF